MKKYFFILIFFPVILSGHRREGQLPYYNVVWNTPPENSRGSMPIGNGDTGSNVWVEPNGELCILLSKTDCWSENGRLLKLGKLRLSMNPNPIKKDAFFRQELNLEKGTIEIEAGEQDGQVKINIRIDANHPAMIVNVESKKAIEAHVKLEMWRNQKRELKGQEAHSAYGIDDNDAVPIYVEPDTILPGQNGSIVWCHRNERSIWKENLKLQALDEMIDKQSDFLLHRTFGCMVKGSGFTSANDSEIYTEKAQKKFSISIYPLTAQTEILDNWLDSLKKNAEKIEAVPEVKRRSEHEKWWCNFWDRSYIYVTSDDPGEKPKTDSLTRGYTLQRYINACSGRGNSPIKFNGSIFTVDTWGMEGKEGGFDPDYRRWGGPYWWQNTRLPYWTMLLSGDFDLMQAMFKMYLDALPMRKLATQKYYGHCGAFYPETIYPWGTYTDKNYGRERTGKLPGQIDNKYIRYYWTSGLEISLMMLDYYSMTLDRRFLREDALPFISEIITFYDQHWSRDEKGKILFDPAMSLETYAKAANPLPEIAGIHKVSSELLSLPHLLTTPALRVQCQRLINELPGIPKRVSGNGKVILAPAQAYSERQNSENPELYAVFPYRIYGVGKPDIEMARLTYADREFKGTGGWQQDAIDAAYLGLEKEAAELTVKNFTTSNALYRFPAMWGPNYDWTPDQDHGCVAMIALQRMLLQCDGEQIYLLPAWPPKWDVTFKLHAQNNTVIEGKVKSGKLLDLKASPEKQKTNLVIPESYD
ncbi:MAG: DUF5703 domain-containing protein [Mangrovibacterium sp.]